MLTGRDVLVTGATGYLGSRLVRAIVARGYRVRALVRAVEHPPAPGTTRVVDVPGIRASD